MARPESFNERILILAPIGRDARACADVLGRAGLACLICPELPCLERAIQEGAGAVVVAEEALFGKQNDNLFAWIDAQPPWSDLPFVILTSRQVRAEVTLWRQRLLESLRNASLLERPLDALTLASVAASAVRSRRRQYEVRAYVRERAAAAETLEAIVAERTSELQSANDALRLQMDERAKAEDALRQSQKMEAVGQLTGGLAHDFNNLLAAITGSLELLQKRRAQDPLADLDRYIDIAKSASGRAAALTHRLLAFSRRQTLDPKPTKINRLVAGLEELIRRTVGPEVTVEVVAASQLWTTRVDPNQLENALLNLCINARDAMPGGGQLVVATANCRFDAREADDRDVPPGDYVALRVSDTGSGMTPEIVARAFDPFFTTKPLGQGTGLGLSMVYGFARQSGGQVRISSKPGGGTTVFLFLPRHIAPVEEPQAAVVPEERPPATSGETVLVIEDEAMVRMLVTDVLRDLGYHAIEADDGVSGLRVLQSDTPIDLVVTDVGLPGGMNGRQVADAGRGLRPGLKVLFITGYAEAASIGSRHLETGMQVLTKPFSMDTLATRITGLLAETH